MTSSDSHVLTIDNDEIDIKAVVNDVYEVVSDANKITVSNWGSYLIEIMSYVDDAYPKIKGMDKKRLAIAIITKFINGNETLTDRSKSLLTTIVANSSETLIDSIVQVSKGMTDINAKKGGKEWFSCCYKKKQP